MRIADVFFQGILAGHLIEEEPDRVFRFSYLDGYAGPPISLTMPVRERDYTFDTFPPFFDGLLPEGFMLEALLRRNKLDSDDRFGQLVLVGGDTVGAVTVLPHSATNRGP
ncbi:MAG: toxin HipA [Desulfobulbaceae bacterium A2]|nr:MAG: toxin HipA [Desulfobulbaceae bacterium A2]